MKRVNLQQLGKQYKLLSEPVEVENSIGEVIGVFVSSACEAETQTVEYTVATEMKVDENSIESREPVLEHMCEVCDGMREECYYMWVDGEERIVCAGCMSAIHPPKVVKSMKRKLRRV